MFPASGYHRKGCFEHSGTPAPVYGGACFGYMPKSGIAESSGRSISNFLRNLQIDFQSGCTSFQSHQQWRSVPLSPHLGQPVLSLEFLILAILTDVRWNLKVVLMCISLMIKDDEHFFQVLFSHSAVFLS